MNKIDKKRVLPVLTEMERVVHTNGKPILANVHLKGDTLTVTNLETSITYKGGITVRGETTAEMERLLKIVRAVNADTIPIKVGKLGQGGLTVGRFSLSTLDPEEFPCIPKAKGKGYKLDDKDLDAMRRIEHATSSDCNKLILNFIRIDAEKRKAVATDGHRLCLESVKYRGPSCYFKRLFLFAQKRLQKAGFEITKIQVDKVASTVTMVRDKETILWTLRMPEGGFPDYERVVPEEERCRMSIPDNLLALLDEPAKALFTDKYMGLQIAVSKKGVTTLYANNPGVAEWEAKPEGMTVVSKEKKHSVEGSFSLNVRYLIDGIKISGADGLGFTEPQSPVTLLRGKEIVGVVMPMMI